MSKILNRSSTDGAKFTGSARQIADTSSLNITVQTAKKGGTGQSSYTVGDILYASGTTALSKLGKGTAGQILSSTATVPAWVDNDVGDITRVNIAASTGLTGSADTTAGDHTQTLSLSTTYIDYIAANNAKVSDINHNVTTDLGVVALDGSLTVTSSDGTNASLPLATASAWGVMSDEMLNKLNAIEASADVTDTANVASAGAVMETDYNTNTVLAADSNNNLYALGVSEQTLVGRITSGGIDALTVTEARTLLNVQDGATADQTNAEIRAAVEAATNSNAFTDADHTKLNGIQGVIAGGSSGQHLAKIDGTDYNIEWVAAGSGSGHAIKDEGGTALTSRPNLNFTGELVEATDSDPDTLVTIDAKTLWLYAA